MADDAFKKPAHAKKASVGKKPKKQKAPLHLGGTLGRLTSAGRISTKALKRLKLKMPKASVGVKAKRGSQIPLGAPRGGVAKGMAGM
jgi:hypothetical protein